MVSLHQQINDLMQQHRSRLLAVLIGKLGDIELAEDALQEAFSKAWVLWRDAPPAQPQSWLLTTAYHQAIDVLRQQRVFREKQPSIQQLEILRHDSDTMQDKDIADDRLKLIFTCCHPALDDASQVALTLCTVCGFSTGQVAAAFLKKTPAMAQRLVRAKRKIKLSGIPYQVPEKSQLAARVNNVLAVIYLIFNQGYYSHDTPTLVDSRQTTEALKLAGMLNELLPAQAEILGLLSLMCFHQSRMAARSGTDSFISLQQQDRSQWDTTLIDQANRWFAQAIACRSLGPYQIQAAISGVHSLAAGWEQTDWPQIIALYHKLLSYQPTDTVRINLAVALIYAGSVKQASDLLDSLDQQRLSQYLPYHLAMAETALRLNNTQAARQHFSQALSLSDNPQEHRFIREKMNQPENR